jgi:hypothetical protein
MVFFAIGREDMFYLIFLVPLLQKPGINNDGQVVGDYRDSSGRFHVFFGMMACSSQLMCRSLGPRGLHSEE